MAPIRRRVITERDIRRAAAEQLAEIDASGAAVTPSAIDLARRLGMHVQGLPHEERLRRTTGRPTRADLPPEPARPANAEPVGPAPAAATPRRIAIGADHGGVELKETLAAHLRKAGHLVTDHGTTGADPVDYPDFALLVAGSVAAGAAEVGIMVDGAGIGSCMVANKVRGVRAAMCYDITTAVNAREHNDANLLTLGGGLIGERLAVAIVEVFLATPFGGGRHARRVAKIDAVLR